MAEADELDKLMPPILRLVHQNYPKADLEPIMHAYRFARAAHEGQFRKSGEPYLIHPIEVCRILAEMGLGVESLCAALLHDTIEDTSVTYNDVEVNFNKNIANLVEGVTKLSKIQYGENASAETIRKMIVAMSKDIRVLVIKLADRLHNARTWKFVPAESAARKAKETLDIYAPLAHRLGLNQVKRELEDLSFKTLHPKVYAEIEELVHQYAPERDEYVKKVMAATEKILNEAKIKATISGRPKHLFSIYQKMIIKGRDFKDIYDLVGIRIITDTILDCYAALGAVHAAWNHIPSRFKDYIAMPKYNMYQSIHTTVIGPERRRVEIQIRTQEMHHFAQFGIAAHWKYKENTVGGGSKGPINRKSGSVN
ncbi:MAG: RelA/SpoT family protein, partial [Candidatus Ancillula sp.]|nr:RelA/SpoT family protein [Candidatus Ancillula sp.]